MKVYRRTMGWFAGTRGGSRFLRFVLPGLDRLALKLTKGRRTFTNHAIPTLILTTTGRKSGEPRAQALCYLRDGSDLVVVGSNWGQEHHPAWTSNLLAEPRASILVEGEVATVEASLVSNEEWGPLYARFEAMSSNYRAYKGRTGGRRIRMFRLTPV